MTSKDEKLATYERSLFLATRTLREVNVIIPESKKEKSRKITSKNSRIPQRFKTKKEKKKDVDPRNYAKALAHSAHSSGDEKEGDDPTRPLAGTLGADHVVSTEFRFKNATDTEYYSNFINYKEFIFKGPQLVDQNGIMYRLGDEKLSNKLGILSGNKLLREKHQVIGKDLIEDAKMLKCIMMWVARPWGKKFLFPWEETHSNHKIRFYDPLTFALLFTGSVSPTSYEVKQGNCTGWVYVDNFSNAH